MNFNNSFLIYKDNEVTFEIRIIEYITFDSMRCFFNNVSVLTISIVMLNLFRIF